MNEQERQFIEAVVEFFSHFADSEWKSAAIKAALEDPFCLGFDAPRQAEWIHWWVVEAGVHINPHFFSLPKAQRFQFAYWKHRLYPYPH